MERAPGRGPARTWLDLKLRPLSSGDGVF